MKLTAHRDTGQKSRSFTLLSFAGLCMVAAAYLFVPTLIGGLVIAVYGSALIIAFGQTGICHAILSQRHIVQIGKMSYSLYLWHWPVLVLAENIGFNSHKLVLFIPIFLLSMCSYYFVERPTRRREGIIPSIAVCYLLTLGLSVVLAFSTGDRYDTSDFEKSHWYGKFYDLNPNGSLGDTFERITAPIETPEREALLDAYLNGGIIVGSDESNPKVVVLGDSHAVMWSDAIRSVTEKLGVKTSFYSMNGEQPFVDIPLRRDQPTRKLSSEEKYQYDKARLGFIKEWKPRLVIFCAAWSRVKESETSDLLKYLEEHSERVLLMEQPPELAYIGNRNAMQFMCFRGIKPAVAAKQYWPIRDARIDKYGRVLVRTLAKKYKKCSYIPTYDLFVKDSESLILDGKNIVYVDDDHLTTYGAQLAIPRIEQSILKSLDADEETVEQE